MSTVRGGLQILKRIKFKLFATSMLSRLNLLKVTLSICECELRGVAWKDAKVKQWS